MSRKHTPHPVVDRGGGTDVLPDVSPVTSTDISPDSLHPSEVTTPGAEGPEWVWALVAPEDLGAMRTRDVRAAMPAAAEPRRAVVNERDLPVFMMVADVAALLRTSPKAIYAKAERGLIPGVIRDGSRLLFDRDVLLRELRRGRGR